MQDYSSDELYNLGRALIEERLSFADFPDDLLDAPDLCIRNEVPAHLYAAVWCFKTAITTAQEPEKTKIQNNLEKANSLMANFIAKTGYNPLFQYSSAPPPVRGDDSKNIAGWRKYR